jgi:tripartite-type tricarboxylate transporter receptor subunit TctC
MPADVVAKLSRDCNAALQSGSVKDRLMKLGATPEGGTPQQLEQLIRAEYEKWGPIIKAVGIKAE